MKVALFLISCLATALAFADEGSSRMIREELPWDKPLNLQEFCGANIDVYVRAREMTHVVAEIVDYTQLVPVTNFGINQWTGYPNNQVILSPLKNTVDVEKKNGIHFPGSHDDMYLLYQHRQSGVKIYFLDTIAPQNTDILIVELPEPKQ